MAKGRSSKAKTSSDDNVNEETNKVSAAAVEPTVDGREVWDIVRVHGKGEATLCRTDGCKQMAVATWATNVNLDDEWPLCESCQEDDFGGWPEGFDPNDDSSKSEESPDATTEETKVQEDTGMDVTDKNIVSENKDVIMEDVDSQYDTNDTLKSDDMDVTMDDVDSKKYDKKATTNPKEDDMDINNEGEDDGEAWELKKIISQASITNPNGFVKCSSDDCDLAACCLYISCTKGEKWYTCIDCQEEHYGGWPAMEELPVTSLDKDHIQTLIDKCSNDKNPAMPPFEQSSTPMRKTSQDDETNTITPLNSGNTAQASKGSMATSITPTPAKNNKKGKQNPTLMKKHVEWQKAATEAGGPDARIVVKKSEAKPLIFDALYDAMKPMNITQIHTMLKATVPSPILKMCLDEMALDKSENQFYDSDDDDAPKKAEKSNDSGDLYAGTLSFKGGRNVNASIYYVDHTKQKNNGNGLEPDQRNELANNLARAQEEESALKAQLQAMTKETTQLLSEPTNEEATASLEQQEAEIVDVREKLEASRALKVNEKYKKQTKARIEMMATQWRKRKRICMDFLIMMEESTEGTISAKKCLAGDGQIDVESDENAIKNMIAYGNKKRSMSSRPVKKAKVSKSLGEKTSGLSSSESLTSGLAPDENFVAVRLDSSGLVERVYLGDNE